MAKYRVDTDNGSYIVETDEPGAPQAPVGPRQPPAQPSFGEQLWQEGVVNPARQVGAGLLGASASTNRLGANIFDLADQLAGRISQTTGLQKGGLFRDISGWLREQQHGQEQQAAELAGGRQDFPSQLYRGVTQGVAELPTYAVAGSTLGPVAGMAAIGAVRESDQGWMAALHGAAEGALLGKALEVMGPASRPIRLTGAAAMTYAQARLNGADHTTALANATTMGLLSGSHGGGVPLSEIAGNIPRPRLKSQLNAKEQAAVQMLRGRGVHIDVPTESGNKFVRGLGAIVQNTPLGALPAWKSLKTTEAGLERVGSELMQEAYPETVSQESAGAAVLGELGKKGAAQEAGLQRFSSGLMQRAHPEAMTPESAGAGIRKELLGRVEGLAEQSGEGYKAAWEHAGDPQFTYDVPVRMEPEIGPDGIPTGQMREVLEPVNMPVDVTDLKAKAKPLFDILQWRPASELSQNAAYAALGKILKGPNFISAIEAEEGLKGLKAMARTANKSGQRDFAQGVAANLITDLQDGIDAAVAHTGDAAIRGLHEGRALWAQKEGIQDIYEDLPTEPVQAMERLLWGRDTGIGFLRQVAKEAPEQMPRLGRALIEKLFGEAQQEGAFQKAGTLLNRWGQIGPETKKILFEDPKLVSDLDKFVKEAARSQKEGIQGIAKALPEEPVSAMKRLVWGKDTGIDFLRQVALRTPKQIPQIGRAVLEDLFTRATRQGGFRRTQGLLAEWENLGPQTKKILYKDPKLIADLDKFFHGADLITRNPNPSGTALVGQTSGLMYMMLNNPATGGAYLLGTGAISKLLYSRLGAKLLMESMNPRSPMEGSRITRNLLGLVGTGRGGAIPVPGGPSRVEEFLGKLGTQAGKATGEFWRSESGEEIVNQLGIPMPRERSGASAPPPTEGLPPEVGKMAPAEAEAAFQEQKAKITGEPVEEFQAAEEGRRGERRLAETSRVYAGERATIADAIKAKWPNLPEKEARKLQRDIEAEVRSRKAQFPTAAGDEGDIAFSPLEVSKINLGTDKKTGEKTFKVEYGATPYSYDAPVRGHKLWARDQLTPQGERVSQKLADQIVAEVQGIRDQAAQAIEKPAEGRTPDERTAIRIAEQRHWYTRMRELLRKQFGSAGDLFADLLGATSARTPVAENFRQAATALERFSKGHYSSYMVGDPTSVQEPILPAYEAHRAAGGTPKKYEGPLALRYGDKKFNANTLAVMDALIGMFRGKESSPKTQNYGGNISGASDAATIDVWAARFLQRMRHKLYGDAPAVPQPAEGAVAGDVFRNPAGELRNTGQFMFGQKVFEKAAAQLDMQPHELQAFLWFLEKDLWTQKGLTSKIGEGGDLAATAKGTGLGRMLAGIEPQESSEPANAIEMMRGAENVASQDPAVKSIVNSHALGMWSTPGGDNTGKPVYSSQFEVTLPEANEGSINRIAAEIVKAAQKHNQDDAFVARTIPDESTSSAYARPGLSVYFKRPLSEADAWKVIEKVKTDNIGGFTLFGGPQSKPGEYVGMRFVYMPEYVHDPATIAGMSDAKVADLVHQGKIDAIRDMKRIVGDLKKDTSIGSAMVELYDVLNANKEDYGRLIEQLEKAHSEGSQAGDAGGTGGGLWRRDIGESVKSRAVSRSGGSTGASSTGESGGNAGKAQPGSEEVKRKSSKKRGPPTAGGLPAFIGRMSPAAAEQVFQAERARRLMEA